MGLLEGGGGSETSRRKKMQKPASAVNKKPKVSQRIYSLFIFVVIKVIILCII